MNSAPHRTFPAGHRPPPVPPVTMPELVELVADVDAAATSEQHMAIYMSRSGSRDLAHELTRHLLPWARDRVLDQTRTVRM